MSETVTKKIRAVRTRLNWTLALQRFIWIAGLTLLGGLGWVLAGKWGYWTPSVEWLIGGGLGLAAIVSGVWTALRNIPALTAACEIDRACDLKERIGTLLATKPEELDSPVGQALKADVEDRLARIDPTESFPVKPPKHAWVPLVPALALALVAWLVTPFGSAQQVAAEPVNPAERQRVEEQARLLDKKIGQKKEELEKLAEDKGLKELVEKVEGVAKELRDNKDISAKEAILKLSDLTKQAEERRKDLEKLDDMKRNLAKLQNQQANGPADKLTQAMKNGDFKEAAKQMEELKKALQQSKLSKEEKDRLAKQFDQVQKQMKEMANLQQRKDQLAKSGMKKEELQKQMQKLAAEAKKLEQLQKLADQLSKCANCNNPDANGQKMAEQAMQNAQDMLDSLSSDDQKQQMLDELMRSLDGSRNSMAGQGQGQDSDEMNDLVNRGDNSRGRGRGAGYREEKEDATKARDTKSGSPATKGKIEVVGRAESKNQKGMTTIEATRSAAAAGRIAEDAVTRQRVPAEYKEHTRDYFNKLNEGR